MFLNEQQKSSTSGFKLKEGSFRLNIRKKLFPVWVVEHWSRLLSEVAAPLLEVFKTRLDGALNTLA